MPSREVFPQSIELLACPVMVVVPEQAPPGSKSEMEVITALPEVQSTRLPGTLVLRRNMEMPWRRKLDRF
jgi:hypothetical protein